MTSTSGIVRLDAGGATYLGQGLGAVADLVGSDDDLDLRILSRDALTELYEAGRWRERESRGGVRIRDLIKRGGLSYVVSRTWGYVTVDCGVSDKFPAVSEQSLLPEPVEFRLLLKCFMQGSSMEKHSDGWFDPYLPHFDLRRLPPELLEHVPALKVRANDARTVLGILTSSVDSTHFPCVVDVPTYPGCCVVRNYHPKRSPDAFYIMHCAYTNITRLWRWFPEGGVPCELSVFRVSGGDVILWDPSQYNVNAGIDYDELVIVTGPNARAPDLVAALPNLLREDDARRC